MVNPVRQDGVPHLRLGQLVFLFRCHPLFPHRARLDYPFAAWLADIASVTASSPVTRLEFVDWATAPIGIDNLQAGNPPPRFTNPPRCCSSAPA